MGRLEEWCDEATFVDWEQAGADLPDWQASYGRLVADGQVARLTQPSAAHHTRDFPAPVVTSLPRAWPNVLRTPSSRRPKGLSGHLPGALPD
jgi:hypothetical protein